jgi:hypothetical protein
MIGHKGKLDRGIWVLMIAVTFLATIVSVSAVTDSNSSNNQISFNVTVIETEDLTLFFTSINEVENRDIVISRNVNFINNTYPISDTGLKIIKDKKFADGANSLSTNTSEQAEQLNTIRINVLSRLLLSTYLQRATNAIAIVKAGYLSPLGATGLNYNLGGADVILIDETQMKTSAHEVGHTMELCEEYSLTKWRSQNTSLIKIGGCPNGDLDGDSDLDFICYDNMRGCPTSTFLELFANYGNDTTNLRNFMGASDTPNFATTPPSDFESWISSNTYNALLNRTNIQSTYSIPTIPIIYSTGEVAVFRVNIFKNNVVNFLNTYVLEEGFIHNSSLFEGDDTINILALNGSIISNISFNPSFKITTEDGTDLDTNITFVSFILPLNGQKISKIVFKNSTTNLSVENVSANTPSVNISPALSNSTHLQDKFNITWTSSDADNDAVYHAILISSTNGTNYTALDIDNNNTYFEIDPSDFEYSEEYVVKILATDGVNTNSSVSNAFTMGTVDLAVISLQEIYSNGPYKIFEVIIENNQSTDLNNLSWSFDLGDGTIINSTQNMSLDVGKSAFVYVEYNYPLESQYTVNATVITGNLTDSKTLNLYASDLIITNLTELHSSNKDKLYEFKIKNNGSDTINNINWSLDTEETTTYANYLTNLNVSEDIMVFFDYTFSGTGDFVINATAFDGASSYSKTINSSVTFIDVSDLAALNISGTKVLYEFIITNQMDTNLTNVTWTLNLGDNNSIDSSELIALFPNNNVFVYVDYTYSSSGSYEVNATAYNNTIQDSDIIEVNI